MDILNNPNVQKAIDHNNMVNTVSHTLAQNLLDKETAWSKMCGIQRKSCIKYLVSISDSEEDLFQSLIDLNSGDFDINWELFEPGDKVGEETKALVKALGGLVAKNGALVMIMTNDKMY